MPHIIVEHTKGCNFQKEELNSLLKNLNTNLSQVESIPIEAIKSRAIKIKHYQKADGLSSNEYVHITCAVMEGRSESILASALNSLVTTAKNQFTKSNKTVALTCEIREMQPHLYFK